MATLSVSCFALGVISGASAASLNSDSRGATVRAATRAAASSNGSYIPQVAQITDAAGNVWTISDAVAYENGAPAGSTYDVAKLLFQNGDIYIEMFSGAWGVWSGNGWVAISHPGTTPASPNGAYIPAVAKITDAAGNVWTVSGGVAYENGAPAGSTYDVNLLLFSNDVIYIQMLSGVWGIWNGTSWDVSVSPGSFGASPNGSYIPSTVAVTDVGGNVWTITGGVAYENGAPAGSTYDVSLLLVENDLIYIEMLSGAWGTWNGGGWVASSDPRAAPPSPSGSYIPAAVAVSDAGGNFWTVSGGVAYENGAPAGIINSAVAVLLFYKEVVYAQNFIGAWYAWNGSAWVAISGPGKTPPSPNGSYIPSVAQITDPGGNIWTIVGGVAYENGAPAGSTYDVKALLFANDVIYIEMLSGAWGTWNGRTWAASGNPLATSSANGTAIPGVAQVTDRSNNVWTLYGGVAYENGAPAPGGTYDLTMLVYHNGVIYIENISGAWWAWNGSSWVTSGDPTTAPSGSATLYWTAPTRNTNGTPLTDLAGYWIYYGTAPYTLTQSVQVTDPTATSCVVGGLSPGTYFFTVSAYASNGTQSPPSASATKSVH